MNIDSLFFVDMISIVTVISLILLHNVIGVSKIVKMFIHITETR